MEKQIFTGKQELTEKELDAIQKYVWTLRGLEKKFYSEFIKMSNYPLHEFQPDKCNEVLSEIMLNISDFYETKLYDSRDEEYERMHRHCIIYNLVGLLNGFEFPEEEKFVLTDRITPNYLERLFYKALIITMPANMKDKITIEGQKPVEAKKEHYCIDIAIMDKQGTMLYCIECDGRGHNAPKQIEEDRIRDENIKSEFPQCSIIRIKGIEIYEGYSEEKRASKKNYATLTAKKRVWDVVENDFLEKEKESEEEEVKEDVKEDVKEEPEWEKNVKEKRSLKNCFSFFSGRT